MQSNTVCNSTLPLSRELNVNLAITLVPASATALTLHTHDVLVNALDNRLHEGGEKITTSAHKRNEERIATFG